MNAGIQGGYDLEVLRTPSDGSGSTIALSDLDRSGIRPNDITISGYVAADQEFDRVVVYGNSQRLGEFGLDRCVPENAKRYVPVEKHHFRWFRFRISALQLPDSCEIALYSEDRESLPARRTLIASLRFLRKQPIRYRASATFTPIVVAAMGRSGTTFLCSMLSTHPHIIAPGRYPFESRVCSYYWHALKVLTAPANHAFSFYPDAFETSNLQTLGYNPYAEREQESAIASETAFDVQDEAYIERSVAHFSGCIEDFIAKVSVTIGKPDAKYFVEKSMISPLNDLVLNLYRDGRRIYLIRDLRDVVCSVFSFNELRGTHSFGVQNRTRKEMLLAYREEANAMVDAYRLKGPRDIFIRFEDMIVDPQAVFDDLCDFLSIERARIDFAAVNRISNLEGHSTAPAAQAVGRWKTDLSDIERDAASESLGQFFDVFGYDR